MSNELKILDTITNIEDLKEYANTQYKTIVVQTKKIHELEKSIEVLENKLKETENKSVTTSTLAIDAEEQTDTETTCVVQIAMIKGLAMNRELTLEEVKKLEILAKTLMLIKGKNTEEKKKDNSANMSTEQLLAWASSGTGQ